MVSDASQHASSHASLLHANLSLTPAARRVLRETFGVRGLRPGQGEVLAAVLEGRDTIAVMPTGSGKSLCYQLPALLGDGLTVVVSPLIALMQDQADKLEALGFPPAVVNSVVGQDELAGLDAAASRILLTTPEQLEKAEVRDAIRRCGVSLFVVDEAHCISQWGHDFRPAYLGLHDATKALGRPPMLALTATATDQVVEDIAEQLRLRKPKVVRTALYRPNLAYAVEHVADEAARMAAVRARVVDSHEPGIVYAATVAMAESIHAMLVEADGSVALYHGRRTAAQRTAAQEAFMTGQARVMVATNAFGMGIDKSDVRFIVHAQFPATLDAYYQESGRAGRDGKTARCTLLFHEGDKRIHRFFMANRYPSAADLRRIAVAIRKQPATTAEVGIALPDISTTRLQVGLRMLGEFGAAKRDRGGRFRLMEDGDAAIERVSEQYERRSRDDHDALRAMIDYARSGRCRWAMLLDYYGEAAFSGECGMCDSCRRMAELAELTELAELAGEGGSERQEGEEAEKGRTMGKGQGIGKGQERPAHADRKDVVTFVVGDDARAPRFGRGEVVAVSDLSVDLRFADGSVRRFLPEYLKPARPRKLQRLAAQTATAPAA
ncbi:RecQ family ATP-dependent DNA helicase [Cupriavidus plantarum]|uniref:RecQ family ATP-dependent DNA helicase n=1 Tax=Cupriavidus plantarum TaxID=942865 RepID=UPI001B03B1B1|nr:RecQ family ATP-dependent DNA helicase [Cupriavidus plantarum]CAG2128611.1 ATP-dependent RNA helicase SrmB [Cupriavidus plantarum]SMR66447.1 ATP-dependent DNA helicase RecQ [Cupriavidus plantarum]